MNYTMPEIESGKKLFNDFITKAKVFTDKQKKKEWFIKRFGENPVDVLGNEWYECLDDYMEDVNNEEQFIDRL